MAGPALGYRLCHQKGDHWVIQVGLQGGTESRSTPWEDWGSGGMIRLHSGSGEPRRFMAYSHSTREACEALRISDRTLLRLRREGVLRAGDHFRAAGAGVNKPPLLWNIEEVERTLARRSKRVL